MEIADIDLVNEIPRICRYKSRRIKWGDVDLVNEIPYNHSHKNFIDKGRLYLTCLN